MKFFLIAKNNNSRKEGVCPWVLHVLRKILALNRGSQGVQVGDNLYLTDLTYADDIALLGDSAEAVQDAVDNIDRFAKVMGLWINASKTKVMSTQPRPGIQHIINLGGVPLEEVESFKYLGSYSTAAAQAKDEISGRIGLARSAFAR